MEAFILLNNAIQLIPSQPNAPIGMGFYWDYYNYGKKESEITNNQKENMEL